MKADQPAPKDTHHTPANDEWGSPGAPHKPHGEYLPNGRDTGQDTAQRSRTTSLRGRTGPTGPRTASGKARASKNATKHGATSSTPINAHEHEVYETFLGQLRAQYPNNNPLITLQLERIQTAISALYDIERHTQVMNLTDEDRSHIATAWCRTMSRDHSPEKPLRRPHPRCNRAHRDR